MAKYTDARRSGHAEHLDGYASIRAPHSLGSPPDDSHPAQTASTDPRLDRDVFTWSASCVVEIMLLSERVGLALALTTTAAVGAGAVVTKRLTAREGRASIKVSDLRAIHHRRR